MKKNVLVYKEDSTFNPNAQKMKFNNSTLNTQTIITETTSENFSHDCSNKDLDLKKMIKVLVKIKKKKMSTVIEFIIKEIFEDDWYTEKGKIFMNFAENMISNKQFVLEELKFPTDNYCADPPQKSLEFIKNKIFKKWNKDKRLKKQKRLSLNIRKSGVKKRAVRKKSNSI